MSGVDELAPCWMTERGADSRFGLRKFADLPQYKIGPGDVIQPEHNLPAECAKQAGIAGSGLRCETSQRCGPDARAFLVSGSLSGGRVMGVLRCCGVHRSQAGSFGLFVEELGSLTDTDGVPVLQMSRGGQSCGAFILGLNPSDCGGVPETFRLGAVVPRAITWRRNTALSGKNSVHSGHSSLLLMRISNWLGDSGFLRTPPGHEHQHRSHESDR
jgi:hypothetical protein